MKHALIALLLVAPLAANADIVDIKWVGGTFSQKANIAPKKFFEICGKLNKGDGVAWQFKGTAPTDFNIHYHIGKDVSYPENRKEIAGADGLLAVSLDQDYCWMWTNRSAQAVDIEVNLKQAAPGK